MKMMKIFDMTNLGLLSSYLDIEVHQDESQITLSQEPDVAHIFYNFKMVRYNLTRIPMDTHLKSKKDGGGRSVNTWSVEE